MGEDLKFQCGCGTVRGVCRGASPSAGIRAVCYCADCRAFAYFLGREDAMLDAHGGTDIYQTAPSRFEIVEGVARLARVILSPKGLNRWYAACCKTALANTPASRALPFVGAMFANFEPVRREAVIGPVATAVFVKEAQGAPISIPTKPMPLILADMMRRASAEWLTGRWRRHPLYAAADAGLVAAPRVLTTEERRALDARAAERRSAAGTAQT